MATLVEVLPRTIDRDNNEVIVISPSAEMNGEFFDGTCNPVWFTNAFPEIANDELPLSREHYDAIKAIDQFWLMNAAQWRKDGVFEVDGLEADVLLDDEEELLQLLNPPEEETTPEEPTEASEEQPTNEEEVTEEA